MDAEEKCKLLIDKIAEKGQMLIAFSGGVDSALLAALAHDVLGSRVRCVLLDSPLVPRAAVRDAERIAHDLGIKLDILPVGVMDDGLFRKNPADRCYHCKKNSAKILKQRAGELGIAYVADGINMSDTQEHRPGLAASTGEGIVHPFIEAGLTKQDIRALARARGHAFWNKPSAACLASRIPYGDAITLENLAMVERAEAFVVRQGFPQCRVRVHGRVARIEVLKEDMETLLQYRDAVVAELTAIGFAYVTLDLAGYRSGSMDEVL